MRGMGKWAWAGMPQVCGKWEVAAQSLDDTTPGWYASVMALCLPKMVVF